MNENHGYVTDIEHQDWLAKGSQKLYGASLDDLPVDMDKPCIAYRCLGEVMKGTKWTHGNGTLKSRSQRNHGSCVGFGEAGKINHTLACGIYMRGEQIDWPTDESGDRALVSPSWSYGASRQVVNKLGGWEGSNGSWAARATEEMGFLFERNYDEIKLSEYRTEDCDRWEARGVPRASLSIADDQLLMGRARIDDVERLVACIQAGYLVNVCGSISPTSTRDEHGFCEPSGRWAHSQTGGICYVVYKTGSKYRRGIGIDNSHGDRRYKGGKGPLTPDLPGGAYIFDLQTWQRLLNERDTWVNFRRQGLQPAQKQWQKRAEKKGAVYASAA